MNAPGGQATGGALYALTGASGFLGSHVADAMLAAGCRVRAVVRPTSSRRWLDGKPLDIVVGDLHDPDACRDLLRGVHGVVHCAGVVSGTDEDGFRRANVDTTAALLEAAGHELGPDGVFLLVSSLAAHGPAGPDAPAREGEPDRPLTAYGRSKLAAEQLLCGRPWPFRPLVLRPPALYGPRDRGFLPLVRAALRGWTAWFGGQMQAVSLVDGRDAAAAVLALLQTPAASGVFYVDDGRRGYDRRSLAAALAEMAGRPVRTVTVPPRLLKLMAMLIGGSRPGRPSVLSADRIRDLETPGWVCDGARLERETGFHAAHAAGPGLGETLAFYRAQGWL